VGVIPFSGTEDPREAGEICPRRSLSQQVILSTDYSTAQNEDFFGILPSPAVETFPSAAILVFRGPLPLRCFLPENEF
jgi:hypothetical protein